MQILELMLNIGGEKRIQQKRPSEYRRKKRTIYIQMYIFTRIHH